MTKEIQKTMHYTSGVCYRVHHYTDGSIGNPEILKKWTSETYAPKSKKKPTKDKKDMVSEAVEEEWVE